MLVLTRKKDQGIKIGEDITITILEIKPDGIKIGIDAPKNVSIVRTELLEEVKEANLGALKINKDALLGLSKLLGDK